MEHDCDLAERTRDLLFNEKYSDVIFIVEGERLPAHRALVTISCDYFRALLEGEMKESLQRDVHLKDIPLRGFKLVMNYVYTGQLQLQDLDEEAILEILGLAHLYGLKKLEGGLSEHLQENLSAENVFAIYSKAHFLRLDQLGEACRSFVVETHSKTLKSDAFYDLSEEVLCHMVSQDTFCVEEINIFNAVVRWCAKQPSKTDHSNILRAIRFPLIDTRDLMTTVKDSGMISTDRLLDAIQTRSCRSSEMNFRGSLKSEVNLAHPDLDALRLVPQPRGTYESSKTCPDYDSKALSPKFHVTIATGLTIALGKAYFINHIAFTFCGVGLLRSYRVEVSLNLEDWTRIIDHSKFSCRSQQQLYFESRVARYIRVTITWLNRLDNFIELSDLKILHTTTPFELKCGFLSPSWNVASTAKGAIVTGNPEGGDAIISDQATLPPEKTRWTSHAIGRGSITIAFPQPFAVDSIRMLLRSDGGRAYKYYVEVSDDLKKWSRVVGRTDDFCRSWQTISFGARPVLSIRIVGTAAAVDAVFSCSRLECPDLEPSRAESSPGSEDSTVSEGSDEIEGSAAKRRRVP